MKSGACLLLLAVLASMTRSVAGVFSLNGMSPVTRVVELLKELQGLCEENLEKETKAFLKYQCWAKTTVDVKTASNEKAQARVDSLEQYIDDLKAGRIELTTERVDLEKEIASVTADLETAEALRNKEHEDFLAAEDETNKAISALDEAIEVLEDAQPAAASFLTASRGSGSGAGSRLLQARKADFERLSHAVEFGRRFLSKGDAIFLERVLTGDVPEADWKKLNRKADFKMSYKTRTSKIVKTLKNLKFTFTQTLEDMTHKEEKAVETYDKLKEAKTAQKDAATEALSKMELEGAARGQTKGEAQTELDDLKTQITNDEKFIEQAKTDLKDKDDEWVARKKVRMDEIAAVSEAIQVLHNDDSRDLFKKSLSSQGYVQISSRGYQLVQTSQSRSLLRHPLASAPARAAAAIRSAAASAASERGQDMRLLELARRVSAPDDKAGLGADKFDEVIGKIDDIVKMLKEDEEADLKTKEECETSRMEDTRESILLAREIDEYSDEITSAKAKIAETEVQIEEKKEEVKAIEEELEEAKKLRGEENAAYLKAKKDDEDAAETIEQAIAVLEGFYKAQMFIQKRQLPSNDFVADAGAAPPPPPKTWDDPSYKGRDKESSGILAILSMIKTDIEKDITKATDAETKAVTKYDTFKAEQEGQVATLESAISDLEGVIAKKEGEVEAAQTSRSNSKGELVALIEKIKELQPGCDYMLVNYIVRSANRKIEIDGLEKAKAILKGAEFDETDPNAELKPGDALLQKK